MGGVISVALLAACRALYVQRQRQALDEWYTGRLESFGFGGAAGRPSFLDVEPVVPPAEARAFRADVRHMVELGTFRQFIAKQKYPRDERWVFAPDERSGECPRMTFRTLGWRAGGDSRPACIFNAKPWQSLWMLLQGGVAHRKESLRELGTRSSFFRADFAENGVVLPAFAADERAARLIRSLNGNEALNAAAKRLYNGTAPIVRPYALYGNLLLPGQELPLHTDVPAFRGLSRGSVPSWLLTVMHNSRLFDRWRLRTATAVLMFPSRAMELAEQRGNGTAAGAFTFHPQSLLPAGRRVAPTRLNSAVMTDSDTVFHGTYAPQHDVPPPTYIAGPAGGSDGKSQGFNPKEPGSTASSVRYDGETRSFANFAPDGARLSPPAGEPGWEEMRLSVSWKAFVFEDAAAAALHDEGRDDLTPERVFDMFERHLREAKGATPQRSDHFAFASQILRHYEMPYYLASNSWNPCALIDVAEDAVKSSWVRAAIAASLSWTCSNPR